MILFLLKYSYDVTVSNVFKEISKNLKTNTTVPHFPLVLLKIF